MKQYRDYTGVARWEVANYLAALQAEGVTFEMIDAVTRPSEDDLYSPWVEREPLNEAVLSRIFNGKSGPVVTLNVADRICIATGAYLTIQFPHVICCPTISQAKKMALDYLGEDADREDVNYLAGHLLKQSEGRILMGEPSFITQAQRKEMKALQQAQGLHEEAAATVMLAV